MDNEQILVPNSLSDDDEDRRPAAEPILRSVSRAERELEKTSAIEEACQTGDREAIAELATSRDGLFNDNIRRKACVYFIKFISRTLQLLILLYIRRAHFARIRRLNTPLRVRREK